MTNNKTKINLNATQQSEVDSILSSLTKRQAAFVYAHVIQGEPPHKAVRTARYRTANTQVVVQRLFNYDDVMTAVERCQAIVAKAAAEATEATEADKAAQDPATQDALREALRKLIGNTLDEKRVTEIAREVVMRETAHAPIRVEVVEPTKVTHDCGTQHFHFSRLLNYLLAGRNVWLAGPAGTGKTTAAENAAVAMGKVLGVDMPFYFNGAIDSEHKLLGFTDAQGRVVSRPFREAFVNGGLYLFDEVDASMPSALLAFNAALSNSRCDFPDGCLPKHPNFRAIAAANTWGFGATHDYVGRCKIDEAFRDRFVGLAWPVDTALERKIALAGIEDKAQGEKWIDYVQRVRGAAEKNGIRTVISPRASINGCALLHQGVRWSEAAEACVRKGLPQDTWNTINA